MVPILILGFCVDSKGFLINILSGTVELLAGIIVGVFIVDKYTAYFQKIQWSKVRLLTYGSLSAHLCDIAVEMLMVFPIKDNRPMGPISDGRQKPNVNTLTALNDLANQLRSLSDGQDKYNISTSNLAIHLYEAIKWDLDQIQDILIPRIVQSSGDLELIDNLVRFDNVRQSLHNAVLAHKKNSFGGAFPKVIELLDISCILYGAIYKKWG